MASENETLEEKKQEDIANVEEKAEVKVEEKAKEEEPEEHEEEEEVEDKEAAEKEVEDSEMVDKDVSPKKVEPEEKGEEEHEEEAAGARKAKRGRKESSKKSEGGSKKAAVESSTTEKKPKSDLSSKEPVTPSERPTRERKTVERYTESSAGRASASKGLSVGKGRGTQLKDIPNVAFKLSKRKPDDNLQILHSVIFGKKTKPHTLKKNVGLFSGFVWVENEEKQRAKIKEKLDKCVKEKLLDFCDILNIPINKSAVKKEELSVKLLEFLESPHATTEVLLADSEKRGKKRKASAKAGKITTSVEAGTGTPAKKQKQTSLVREKRKRSSKIEEEDDEVDDKVDPLDSKEDSVDEDDNDAVPNVDSDQEESKSDEEEGQEEVEPQKQKPVRKSSSKKNVKKDSRSKTGDKSKSVKKGGTVKSVRDSAKSAKTASKKNDVDADGASGSTSQPTVSSTKKPKVEKERKEQSLSAKEKASAKKQSSKSFAKVLAKDQGKEKPTKKAKAEPSKKEMHAVVVDILKEVDFNTATLSDILRQLGTHFGVDLMHRKAEVKAIITDVINNMTDEDEGEEAEAGDDGEKDGDEDKDA